MIWSILILSIILCSSCEREGWDSEGIGLNKKFKPVENIRVNGGYGKALLQWDLPDSTSNLRMIKVEWENDSANFGEQIYSGSIDSVWISELTENNYRFIVSSLGEDGEVQKIEPISSFIQDEEKEPTVKIEAFSSIIVVNFLMMKWEHPNHQSYRGVEFKVFDKDSVELKKIFISKDDEPKYDFELGFITEYICSYGSVNTVDSIYENTSFKFATGAETPDVPMVSIDSTSFFTELKGDTIKVYDFCHSAEVKWTPTVNMDSIMIGFIDLYGNDRSSVFGGNTGFLSLLPGGTVVLSIQVKEADGVWSLPKEQTIKTQLKEEITKLNYEVTLWKGNLSLAIAESMGVAGPVRGMSFQFTQLASLKKATVFRSIRSIKELELCVSLEEIHFKNFTYNPTDDEITMDDYRRLIRRLPMLKKILMNTANKPWPHIDELEAELLNHPTIEFVKL